MRDFMLLAARWMRSKEKENRERKGTKRDLSHLEKKTRRGFCFS